jgi:aspartate oxidase
VSYPAKMMLSVKNVEETRKGRLNTSFPELSVSEKAKLLEQYHPDFNQKVKRELRVGVNTGDLAPSELADLLEASSRLNINDVNLDRPDYQTDVLIIGGGGGGLSAAITAKENGADVILATKLRMGDSNTIMAEGGIGAATLPEDSPVIHYVDTMVGGRGKNIPELVETLVNDAPFIVDWLSSLGVNFDRLEDGTYFTHRPGGHSRRRSHSVMDLTGLEIMRVLGDEVRNRNIQILEFSPAVELLVSDDGKCAGAVLYNFDNDTYVVVQAKVTILATGGMGRLHPLGFPTSNHYGATADGLIMAYRAGAKLLYVESVQFHPTGTAWPEQRMGLLISEALRAQGAQVVNVEGEMFAASLETRDALAAAIIRECGDRGKGVTTPTGMTGVWLDTPLIDMIHGDGTFTRRFAGIYARFQQDGINPVEEPILVYPTQHYQNGGVAINRAGETSIPNLYAVGEVSGGVHGHNRLGSNSLLDIFVFGRRAGKDASGKVSGLDFAKPALTHIERFEEELSQANISSQVKSPLILPDYRFEKALTTIEHIG